MEKQPNQNVKDLIDVYNEYVLGAKFSELATTVETICKDAPFPKKIWFVFKNGESKIFILNQSEYKYFIDYHKQNYLNGGTVVNGN